MSVFRDPHAGEVPQRIELIRSTEEEKQSQLKRLREFKARHKDESGPMLLRLQQAVIANQNVFEVLVDAVRCCSLGQITNALFEVGGSTSAACNTAAPFRKIRFGGVCRVAPLLREAWRTFAERKIVDPQGLKEAVASRLNHSVYRQDLIAVLPLVSVGPGVTPTGATTLQQTSKSEPIPPPKNIS